MEVDMMQKENVASEKEVRENVESINVNRNMDTKEEAEQKKEALKKSHDEKCKSCMCTEN